MPGSRVVSNNTRSIKGMVPIYGQLHVHTHTTKLLAARQFSTRSVTDSCGHTTPETVHNRQPIESILRRGQRNTGRRRCNGDANGERAAVAAAAASVDPIRTRGHLVAKGDPDLPRVVGGPFAVGRRPPGVETNHGRDRHPRKPENVPLRG